MKPIEIILKMELLKEDPRYLQLKDKYDDYLFRFLSLNKLGLESSDSLIFDLNENKLKIWINYIEGKGYDRILFCIYEKIHPYVEEFVNYPNLNKIINSYEIKESLNNQILDLKKINNIIKNKNYLWNIHYNSKKENLIYRLWKNNNDKYHSSVVLIKKQLSEEEFCISLGKFYNPVLGSKLFLKKRYSLIKNNNFIIEKIKENNLIYKILENTITTNNLKNNSKKEIFLNIIEFIKKNNIENKEQLSKDCFDEILKKNNMSIYYRTYLLSVLLKFKLRKEQVIVLKYLLYLKRMLNKEISINSIESFLAIEKYYFQHRYSEYPSIIPKGKKFKKEELDLIKKLLMKEGLVVSRKKKRNKLPLLFFLNNNNIEFNLNEMMSIIKEADNFSFLVKENHLFLNYYKKHLLKNKEDYILFFKTENGLEYLKKICNKTNIYYWIINNEFISFKYLIGNKEYNLNEVYYSPVLDYDDVQKFFNDYDLKNKKVRKAIYENIYNEDNGVVNLGIFNRIIAMKQNFLNIDEQKLLPLISYYNILNNIDIFELVKNINSLFDLSMDRLVYLISNSNEVISQPIIYPIFGQQGYDSIIRDTNEMILRIQRYLRNEEELILDDEQMDFCIDSLKNIKKSKIKTIANLHDMLSKLLTKLGQPNYDLKQDKKFLEYDKDEIVLNNEKFEIFIPSKNHDLIDIGESLNICVGNGYYGKNVLNQKITILSLIQEAKIKACIEIDSENGKIIQSVRENNYLFEYIKKGNNIYEYLKNVKK